MAGGIDPVQFGRLLGAVETLTKNVESLSKEVKELDEKLSNVRMVFFGSKWFAVGVILVSGIGGAGATRLVEHLFTKV